MKPRKLLLICGLGVLVCALSACSSASSYVRPGYDFQSVGKVACIVTTNAGSLAQKREIADLFAMQVLMKGYDVIDRANIEDLEKEAAFQNTSGITSAEGRAKLAIHNVSTVILSNVTQMGEDISLTAKMVDVETGTIVWTGEGTGSLKSWLGPAGVGLLGAGVGAVTGGLIGGRQGAIIGGVAGGAGGGVAGGALSPSMAKLMRKVITKTCRGLPAVGAAAG